MRFDKLAAMQQAIAGAEPLKPARISKISSLARAEAPTAIEWGAAVTTGLLLILSFPNFELSLLAWISLVPLLLVIAHRPSPARGFILGWTAGSLFFYVSCQWLTYSMIHYGDLPPWLAYLLLAPAALVSGLFPGLFGLSTALSVRRWGSVTILLTPFYWAAFEWARLRITGQLWNAIGYSQAYNSLLIQPARWGGVYAVGFLILSINASITFTILKRQRRALAVTGLIIGMVALLFVASIAGTTSSGAPPSLYVVALQPNVPMNLVKSADETKQLLERHLSMSVDGLKKLPEDNVPRLVVWPESPMNFTYAANKPFQDLVAKFAKDNHTSLLFNSLEPAPGDGAYNSALLINEEGRLISQYDKIRLMPFGEYVPLPQWLGGSLISGLVGDFTPGTRYTLMPVGSVKVGTFICIESAYPFIARRMTDEGADVLINISNDGYLGPTAVMRQHLANVIFRAVENGRPLVRVTNSGISGSVRADGFVSEQDLTKGFQPDVRNWAIGPSLTNDTFYKRHGDLFVQLCTLVTIVILATAAYRRRRGVKEIG